MKSRQFPAPCTLFVFAAVLALGACGERSADGAIVIEAAGPRSQTVRQGAVRLPGCDGGIVVAGFPNSHVHSTEAKFANAS